MDKFNPTYYQCFAAMFTESLFQGYQGMAGTGQLRLLPCFKVLYIVNIINT